LTIRDVLIENKGEHWETRVDRGVTHDEVAVVDGNRDEEVETSEDCLDKGDNHATMDNELGQGGASLIGQTTVPDDQLFDVAESLDGEIGSERGLHAFLAYDSKSNVSFLNHCYIVATVTDAGNDLTSEMLDVYRNNSFLGGAAPTYTDCPRLLGYREELFAETFIGDDNAKCRTVDHEHVSGC